MKEFMFLTRGYDNPSPEEMQQRMGVFVEWMQKLTAEGRYKGGQPLDQSSGRLVVNKTEVLTDGPFMEAKEIIGGYVVVLANDIDEAAEMAKSCPMLDHCALEVRQLKEMD